jgi:hypothetical protein
MENINYKNILINYEFQSSNSNNYVINGKTPSSQSIPSLLENTILVKYETLMYSTEIVSDRIIKKNNK